MYANVSNDIYDIHVCICFSHIKTEEKNMEKIPLVHFTFRIYTYKHTRGRVLLHHEPFTALF